jgi:GxxExxY protein
MAEVRAIDAVTEDIAVRVVDAKFQVHRTLGPGLLESVYEKCLAIELQRRGLKVEQQVCVPIVYAEQFIEPGLRIDLLVENAVLVEVKAAQTMHPIFQAQLLTYLKLTGHRLGFIANFDVILMKDGLKRVIL